MNRQPTPPPQSGQIILVVEDNEDLRENAALVLTLEGYTVFSAMDGQEALDMLQDGTCSPDLIVSDIAMPRLDGYGFFAAVRDMPTMRAIPFIFLTARGSRRDIRFGKELGADDYLVKPFNSEDFLAAVRNKLRRIKEIRDQASTELDEARRTMVQLLSHELRTPLTYVTGGFSLLAEGLEQERLPDDMRISMGLIRSGTQRLNHLAEQLVLYAELISGHGKIQFEQLAEAVDLEQLVRQAAEKVISELPNKRVQFVLDSTAPYLLEVYGVADLLRTAFYEVVRNAITFSKDGNKVQVHVEVVDNQAVVHVIDHGTGITAADQATIWNVMIQSNRVRQEQQGAGMGLPIVKQVALLHKGEVSLASEPNKGTVVTLRFPLYHHA